MSKLLAVIIKIGSFKKDSAESAVFFWFDFIKRIYLRFYMDAIFLHSSAHELQILAHFWQCSSLNIAQSCAHFLQIVSQSAQCSFENCPLIDIIATDI
jgi:hypothetical protein